LEWLKGRKKNERDNDFLIASRACVLNRLRTTSSICGWEKLDIKMNNKD
jgi:hypothetical protein